MGSIGYAGYYLDAATGLSWTHWRVYDVATGQWLTEDPIGFAAGDSNIRRYVGNGASNGVDPSGLIGPADGPSPQQRMEQYEVDQRKFEENQRGYRRFYGMSKEEAFWEAWWYDLPILSWPLKLIEAGSGTSLEGRDTGRDLKWWERGLKAVEAGGDLSLLLGAGPVVGGFIRGTRGATALKPAASLAEREAGASLASKSSKIPEMPSRTGLTAGQVIEKSTEAKRIIVETASKIEGAADKVKYLDEALEAVHKFNPSWKFEKYSLPDGTVVYRGRGGPTIAVKDGKIFEGAKQSSKLDDVTKLPVVDWNKMFAKE